MLCSRAQEMERVVYLPLHTIVSHFTLLRATIDDF